MLLVLRLAARNGEADTGETAAKIPHSLITARSAGFNLQLFGTEVRTPFLEIRKHKKGVQALACIFAD
jgi:hypothetical protein